MGIEEIAEAVLESGRDRISRLPDMRKLPRLRRMGLLVYPDGYSVTADAMERAAQMWGLIAKDAEQWGNPLRAAELRDRVARALAWAAQHNATSEIRKQRFDDLSFDLYRSLWDVVVAREGLVDRGVAGKGGEILTRRGYLVDHSIPSVLAATHKAQELVRKFGNPFFAPVSRVAARFLDAT